MIDFIYLYCFYFFRFLIVKTPKIVLNLILDTLYHLAYFLDFSHRKIIKTNLDFAFRDTLSESEKNRIVKKCYKNMLYNLADFVKNQGTTKQQILQKVTFENEHFILEAIKSKKNIILITAHYGNWELLPLVIAAKYFPLTGIGRPLDSKVVDQILSQNREQFDINMLDKNGAMRGMVKTMQQKRALGILVDQNTSDNEGILIDFFDKKARHTPSASILARKFDATIQPAYITTDDYENFTITFYEPILCDKTDNQKEDILKCTQAQASITQKIIEQKPDEWFWFHKRWKNQHEEIYR